MLPRRNFSANIAMVVYRSLRVTRRTNVDERAETGKIRHQSSGGSWDWDLLVSFFLLIGQGTLPCFIDARADLATWFALARSTVARQAGFARSRFETRFTGTALQLAIPYKS